MLLQKIEWTTLLMRQEETGEAPMWQIRLYAYNLAAHPQSFPGSTLVPQLLPHHSPAVLESRHSLPTLILSLTRGASPQSG